MSGWKSKKITTRTGATETILQLKGKLAGPWVQQLHCWERIVKYRREAPVRLGG